MADQNKYLYEIECSGSAPNKVYIVKRLDKKTGQNSGQYIVSNDSCNCPAHPTCGHVSLVNDTITNKDSAIPIDLAKGIVAKLLRDIEVVYSHVVSTDWIDSVVRDYVAKAILTLRPLPGSALSGTVSGVIDTLRVDIIFKDTYASV